MKPNSIVRLAVKGPKQYLCEENIEKGVISGKLPIDKKTVEALIDYGLSRNPNAEILDIGEETEKSPMFHTRFHLKSVPRFSAVGGNQVDDFKDEAEYITKVINHKRGNHWRFYTEGRWLYFETYTYYEDLDEPLTPLQKTFRNRKWRLDLDRSLSGVDKPRR